MMTIQELEERYVRVPLELKQLKRWVGYRVEEIENGKTTKRPYNSLTGAKAKVNDSLTWSTFKLALSGCAKYGYDGIGFVLGDGIFGIDLDNHKDSQGNLEIPEDEFKALSSEFIDTLNSYTELSQSGNGIHIICKGKLPEGSRRKNGVEMYDSDRFFVFTGKAINNVPIQDREEEIKPLWEKYIYTPAPVRPEIVAKPIRPGYEVLTLTDEEVIDRIMKSKQSDSFYRYYHNGDVSRNGNDQSSADLSFCSMLAFWCNRDKSQMDRIFRNSALMRDKWDQYRGQQTYGEITLEKACQGVSETYRETRRIENDSVVIRNKSITPPEPVVQESVMNIDENGEPIFRIKKIYGSYPYSDTGNALKFYDYFGEYFKYNVTDKIFMFWTGKTWIRDNTQIIRKYANKFIEILKEDDKALEERIAECTKLGQIDDAKRLTKVWEMALKNTTRVANKAGKDAMLSEFQSLKDIPVESSEFDKDEFLLNTDSGIVDLRTGEIGPFDKTKLMSKNTNTQVSFERSEVWENFLFSIFNNGDIVKTTELIDSLQTCLGYSLSGSTREQVMFLLYGEGSNGKSTLTETISDVLGSYSDSISSTVLMQQKGQNSSAIYSIAKLQTVRFVETGETDDGGKLNEAQLKILTGTDRISAQFKFGHEFSFKPKFKIWMSTNNKPVIHGTDHGIWRRLFLFPFVNIFSEEQKDKDLPAKLRKDADKILGWCIKGFLKYQEQNGFITSEVSSEEKKAYQIDMDITVQFIEKNCVLDPRATIECDELYNAYKAWGANNTEWVMKESRFSAELKKQGITQCKNNLGVYFYKGVRMNGVYIRKNQEYNE